MLQLQHKNLQHTIKDEQREIIQGNFYQKELSKVSSQWIRLQ